MRLIGNIKGAPYGAIWINNTAPDTKSVQKWVYTNYRVNITFTIGDLVNNQVWLFESEIPTGLLTEGNAYYLAFCQDNRHYYLVNIAHVENLREYRQEEITIDLVIWKPLQHLEI